MLAALGLSLNSTLINPSAGRAAGGATVLSVTVLPNPPSMGGVVRLKLQLRALHRIAYVKRSIGPAARVTDAGEVRADADRGEVLEEERPVAAKQVADVVR